jgi:hypothetical protein
MTSLGAWGEGKEEPAATAAVNAAAPVLSDSKGMGGGMGMGGGGKGGAAKKGKKKK